MTITPPGPPTAGCYFCDGTGLVNETSYATSVADGCGRIALKPGSRCLCTVTWAEMLPALGEIVEEIVNGHR